MRPSPSMQGEAVRRRIENGGEFGGFGFQRPQFRVEPAAQLFFLVLAQREKRRRHPVPVDRLQASANRGDGA